MGRVFLAACSFFAVYWIVAGLVRSIIDDVKDHSASCSFIYAIIWGIMVALIYRWIK